MLHLLTNFEQMKIETLMKRLIAQYHHRHLKSGEDAESGLHLFLKNASSMALDSPYGEILRRLFIARRRSKFTRMD
jgi:hypothetical protein